MDNQTVILIYLVVVFWGLSAFYVLKWCVDNSTLNIGTIFLSILCAPALSIVLKFSNREKKEEIESENDRHRRWFRTMGEINRQRTPTWFRTIPPPPPISSPPNRRPNITTREFKFLRDNDKDR
jgi:hypothetical protein